MNYIKNYLKNLITILTIFSINLYNPKDGVARTEAKLPDLDINLSHLYDIHTEKDLSD